MNRSVNKPRVSVCVPNYNYVHFVGKAIESVLAQDFEDYELVIVDDASTDNSVEVISRYQDPRIRFVRNEKNLGRLDNINKCFSLARGEYVNLLPADCYFTEYSLSKRVHALEKNPKAVFAFGSTSIVDEKGKTIRLKRPFVNSRCWNGRNFFELLIKGNITPNMSVLFKRDLLDASKAGLWGRTNARSARDWLFWLRSCFFGDVCFVDSIAACNIEHRGNYTSYTLLTGEEFENQFLVVEQIFKEFGEMQFLEKRALRRLKGRIVKSIARRVADTKTPLGASEGVASVVYKLFKLSLPERIIIHFIRSYPVVAKAALCLSRRSP
jgi:glycosyltransferase involved in cell wall biosynthesis